MVSFLVRITFAERSDSHKEYFHTGHLDLVAFYFGKDLDENTHLTWIREMKPAKEAISEYLGMDIVMGLWGKENKNWAWIATCLQKQPENRDEWHYAATIAKFIEATHGHVKRAIQVSLS